RRIGDDPGLRIGELDAQRARRNGRFFHHVGAEIDARRATVHTAYRRAIDVDVGFTGTAAANRYTRAGTRLDHAGGECDYGAHVFDREMIDEITGDARFRRDLIA